MCVLINNVLIAVPSRTSGSYIPNFEQEVALFEGTELWFLDDNGNPVRVTLDPIPVIQFVSDISQVVKFKLYTRETGKNYEILHIGDEEALAKSQFDPKKPTRFFAHGWHDSSDGKISVTIRDGNIIIN